jgi:hypothetical protein
MTCKLCNKKIKAKGYCQAHYFRLRTYGDAEYTKQKLYELNGARKTRTDWARALGISAVSLNERLLRGWPVELALTLPRQKQGGLRIKGHKVIYAWNAEAPRPSHP